LSSSPSRCAARSSSIAPLSTVSPRKKSSRSYASSSALATSRCMLRSYAVIIAEQSVDRGPLTSAEGGHSPGRRRVDTPLQVRSLARCLRCVRRWRSLLYADMEHALFSGLLERPVNVRTVPCT
jgi:hypothetical protein